jgi:hypothetical protein
MDIRIIPGRKNRRKSIFRNKIILFPFLYLLINLSLNAVSQNPDQKTVPAVKKEFGSIRIHLKTAGKLFIDNVFIKELISGQNLISPILVGDHSFFIVYKDHKEGSFYNIKKNRIEEVFFYYRGNTENFERVNKKIIDNENEITEIQKKILDKTFEFIGKPPYSKVVVNDRSFILDCIGFISAVFYSVGFDLQKEISPYQGNNGVTKLFYYLSSKKQITQDKIPEAGDIIIWDNTWDYNNDGRFGNDPLTHAGFVTKVDDDGTIHFVHVHITLGVVVERINLYKPDQRYDVTGKEINTPMHAQSALNFRKNLPYLSGELWRTTGKILKNE